jgi:twitching motility protein PilT
MEFHEMLRKMVIEKASDLVLKVGSPPTLRIDGTIHFLDTDELTQQDMLEIFEIIEDSKKDGLDVKSDIDVAYELPGIGRFRVNIFHQKGHLGFVLRHIESQVPPFEELSLPAVVLSKLASATRGLVLVTGQAGSGKSTTLAAMINFINERFNKHIVTIEDPIEFVFRDRKSIINQREIGQDVSNFIHALKMAVRQSPDAILIGEMRDRETVEAALAAAETGHLVLSTLHSVNAVQTVERIIQFFPPHQHDLIRLQLSLVLVGVGLLAPPAEEELRRSSARGRAHDRVSDDPRDVAERKDRGALRCRQGRRVLRLPDFQPVAEAPLPGRPHHARARARGLRLPRRAQAGSEGHLQGRPRLGLQLQLLIGPELRSRTIRPAGTTRSAAASRGRPRTMRQ